MNKKLKNVSVKINAQEFSNWIKKHSKYINDDIFCDLLVILDMSEIDGCFGIIDFSKTQSFNQDISKWKTAQY